MPHREGRNLSPLKPLSGPHTYALIFDTLIGLSIGLGCWAAHSAWRRRNAARPESFPLRGAPLPLPGPAAPVASDVSATGPLEDGAAPTTPTDTEQTDPQEIVPVVEPTVIIPAPPRRRPRKIQEVSVETSTIELAERPMEDLANSIGRELANLATAVQGNAQLLCEVMGEPELLPNRCEQLWAGVQRLRLLTDKLLTFATRETPVLAPMRVDAFLNELQRDIESIYGSRINVHTSRTQYIPAALAHQPSLHNAMMFIVEALFETEPQARSLSIAAIGDEDDDSGEITMRFEICAETETPVTPMSSGRDAIEFCYLAARRTLDAQHATLRLQFVPGISATSIIALDAIGQVLAQDEPAPTPFTPSAPHEYGGVLVLEPDAPIRDLIATEVERCHRKILTALDAASAKALLDATPERFELLILDGCSAFEDTLRIARIWLSRTQQSRVLLLVRPEQRQDVTKRVGADVHVLCKPFGALELRAQLGELLELESDPTLN